MIYSLSLSTSILIIAIGSSAAIFSNSKKERVLAILVLLLSLVNLNTNDKEFIGFKEKINRIAPRVMSSDQKIKLVHELEFIKNIEIGFASKLFDSEARELAEQLYSAFLEAGARVKGPINQTLTNDSGYEGKVVIATNYNKLELKKIADRIYIALNQSGIPSKEISFNEDIVWIVIGSK